ncbi:hypothetical protein BI364_01205 [Acidihalobacter yilgarnensis]|uniref:DUF6933 domain-containing protein n=1 Tax=Acidihalobacter yilgarnensis TaxID=2819280 RepID=A0A1D8IK28_9GAMM|nr:hypothetical protein [Acidihalobacter yilgarnensis]AOU96805.1 hypothetical protein BI364_01205 [Acidihalobacter yilgarnensis]
MARVSGAQVEFAATGGVGVAMLIHCTQRLATMLPAVSHEPQAETSPLGSWHAHLYRIDRRHVVMFCHDETRYTLYLPGVRKLEFCDLGHWFKDTFLSSLAYMGMPDNQVLRAELALGPATFDTCTNRSVLASLNRMRYRLDTHVLEVADVMLLNPMSVNRGLCRYATSRGKTLRMMDEVMMERVAGLPGSVAVRMPLR